jgi:ubiquitin-activating enzyme E1
VCTLKNFPNAIEHTLQYARDWFEGSFVQVPANVNAFGADRAKFLKHLEQQCVCGVVVQPRSRRDDGIRRQNSRLEVLEGLVQAMAEDKPATFEDCLAWARRRFELEFSSMIKQLLHNFPPGMLVGCCCWDRNVTVCA